MRITPSGGTANTDRNIMVTAYFAGMKVGTRVLNGAAAAANRTYASVGFGGARFNTLVFTVADNQGGAFSLNAFAVCASVYPCATTVAGTQTSLTTGVYDVGTVRTTDAGTQAATALDDGNPVFTATSKINAAGVIAMSTGNTLAIADGTNDGAASPTPTLLQRVIGTGSGTPRNLTNVGGDIYFIRDAGANTQYYFARRTTASTTTYLPTAITDGATTPNALLSCLDDQMVAVGDALFFQAANTSAGTADANCGLWRIRADETTATRMTLPSTTNFTDSSTKMFEAQGRLYITSDSTAYGYELFRYTATGQVNSYTAIDINPGTGNSVFPSLASQPPVTLPGPEGYLDALFFRTTTGLYVIYKDATTASTGAASTTAHAVNLSDGGSGLGEATGIGTGAVTGVVATYEMGPTAMQWVYYVDALRQGTTDHDVFRLTAPDGNATTASSVTCLGYAGSTPPTAIAASNGYSYIIGTDSGQTRLIRGHDTRPSGDYGATCTGTPSTNGRGGDVMALTGAIDIDSVSGIHLAYGGLSDGLAGTIYTQGTVAILEYPYRFRPTDNFAQAINDSSLLSLICGAISPGTAPQRLSMIQDDLFFTANTLSVAVCSGSRYTFYHAPTSISTNAVRASTVTNATSFLPLNESASPRNWAGG